MKDRINHCMEYNNITIVWQCYEERRKMAIQISDYSELVNPTTQLSYVLD